MRLGELTEDELAKRLSDPGIWLHTGPFVIHLRSSIPSVAAGLARMYADFPLAPTQDYADFHVSLRRPRNLRRWLRPQVLFYFDERSPFQPLPYDQAYPMVEWCLNWCVTAHVHTYLIVHAAVVERDGRALILPAPPGSGKSTLCAGLMLSGWRLLSDELTLLDLTHGHIVPLPRPVSLKNNSIDVIAAFAPQAVINQRAYDTAKGTVAHVRPTPESVQRVNCPASAAWIVFPRWNASAATAQLTPYGQATTFMRLAENAFNYSVLGEQGFAALTRLVEHCQCFEFEYAQLAEAVALFQALPPPP